MKKTFLSLSGLLVRLWGKSGLWLLTGLWGWSGLYRLMAYVYVSVPESRHIIAAIYSERTPSSIMPKLTGRACSWTLFGISLTGLESTQKFYSLEQTQGFQSLEQTRRFHSLDRHNFIIDFVVLVFKLSVWVLLWFLSCVDFCYFLFCAVFVVLCSFSCLLVFPGVSD